jgi:hypothetical protein
MIHGGRAEARAMIPLCGARSFEVSGMRRAIRELQPIAFLCPGPGELLQKKRETFVRPHASQKNA